MCVKGDNSINISGGCVCPCVCFAYDLTTDYVYCTFVTHFRRKMLIVFAKRREVCINFNDTVGECMSPICQTDM